MGFDIKMAARMHGISEAVLRRKLDHEIAKTEDHLARITKTKKRPRDEDSEGSSKIKVLMNNSRVTFDI